MSQKNDSSTRKRTQGQASRTSSSRSPGSHSTSGYSSSRRSGHKRNKSRFDITHYLMFGFGILILIVCVVLLFKGCSRTGANAANTEAESTVEETELEKQVTVDGISIAGMTREKAREAIEEQYDWSVKVTYKEKETQVTNLIEARIEKILDEVYDGQAKESYEIDLSGLTEEIKTEAAAVAAKWDVAAKNGGVSGYDKDSGKFSFSDGTPGVVINQDKLVQDLEKAVADKKFDAVIIADAAEVQPEVGGATAKEKYVTLGTFSTTTTTNKDRNENIRLAAAALNGVILQPGEEFSFNDTTGARTLERGYKPAGAYVNGILVEEPGGGVCQVSSTIYNSVIFSGLKTTERRPHSYEPSYVTPGEDAMVSFGSSDMKFVNTSKYPIAIKASFADRKLTTAIYGVPILEEGVKVKMRSEKTGQIDPPAPTYEEDQTLQPGVEVVVKDAKTGSRWATYMETYKDGKKVSEEFFHNSSYLGKAATIKRNTSGVVVTTPAETTVADPLAPSESTGAVTDPTGANQPTTSAPSTAAPGGPGEVEPTPAPTTEPSPNPVGPGGGGNVSPGAGPGGSVGP